MAHFHLSQKLMPWYKEGNWKKKRTRQMFFIMCLILQASLNTVEAFGLIPT
jgi:hypothetical protein